MSNKFSGIIKKVHYFPQKVQPFLLTKLFCSKVKFAGTSGIRVLSVSHHQVVIELENKKKVQNHIGGVHAIAAALIAESATGIVFGMNVPDKSLPLLKSMKVNYQRRMQGKLTAIASIEKNLIEEIENSEKGDLIIPVIITDESNQQPITCEMEWAWVSKSK